jgi:Aegerolysin
MKFAIYLILIIFLSGCGTSDVPEMKEFMDALSSKEKISTVAKKYSSTPGIIPEALQTCNLGASKITNTDEKNGIVRYTAEVKVESCDKSETAAGTVRTFDIAWKDGKIVSFDWKGPKSGKVEY